MKKSIRKVLVFSLYILAVLLLVYFVVSYVGRRIKVEGSSMEPLLYQGDHLIVDKLTYRFEKPERFDVIVASLTCQKNILFVKRIIGLPGETVWISNEGFIYIDGELLQETYGLEKIQSDKTGLASSPVQLSENEYFVLGDNRNNSLDSRDPAVGIVSGDAIIGKIWLRIFPFTRFGVVG